MLTQAWQGTTSQDSRTILLPAAISQELYRQFAGLHMSPYEDIEAFLQALRRLAGQLPESVVCPLLQFGRDPRAHGMLGVHGLPVGNLPPTPADGKQPRKQTNFIAEASALLVASLLGEVYAFKNEKAGELLQTIAPVQESALSVSNAGSRVDLLLHTEDVHLSPLHPDFVVLFCLRADRHREAATLVVDIRDALATLSQDTIEVLRQPFFTILPPESFGGQSTASTPTPILRGPVTMPEVALDFNAMTTANAQAEAALTALQAACYRPDVLHQVYAEPGDLLLIDNRKAIHGRNTFQPLFDGYDRWLLRLFVKTNLFWLSRGLGTTSPRVLDL